MMIWHVWDVITMINTAALLAFMGMAVMIFIKFKKINKKHDAMSLILKEQNKQRQQLHDELKELRNSLMSVGQRVLTLERHYETVSLQMEEIALQDPEAKMYSRALKMVDLGADIEEIVAECELPQAEVELLIRLNRQTESESMHG